MNAHPYHMHNRPNREIKDNKAIVELLKAGKYCTIAMCRQNEPYIVTLSYGYDFESNALYFHCAKSGLKMDFIGTNPLVCATVIADGGYVYGECGHNYKSIVIWGNVCVVDNLDECKYGMNILLNHLEKDADVITSKLLKSNEFYSEMRILRLDISEIHGKEGR